MKRWVYFLVGGGLNTALTYGVYLLLAIWLNYQVAYGIAYALGILFAYLFNSKMVFNAARSLKGLLIYPAIYVIQYLIGATIVGLLVEIFNTPKGIAPLAAIALLIPASFFLNKWVLQKFAPLPCDGASTTQKIDQ